MKKCNDTLLLKFLMFSKDIDKEIVDFSDSLSNIDIDVVENLIESIEEENIYTVDNIENLIKIVKNLKNKLSDYEDNMYTLLSVIPSNDIYYYEFMNKWNVLEEEIENPCSIVSKELLEKSIRFDFYAFSSLTVSADDYIEKFLSNLINNPLYLLFINKLMTESPDIFLDKNVNKRICSILEFNIKTEEDNSIILYNEKLLKKVKYYGKNKKIEKFDYEKFNYYMNNAFINYLITSDEDFKEYHNYLISEQFIYYIELYLDIYDVPEENSLWLHNKQMVNKIKEILGYILNFRQDNYYKVLYNKLMFKLNHLKLKEELEFYENELFIKYKFKDIIKERNNRDYLLNNIKSSLKADYYIMQTYCLPKENFENTLDYICPEYYIMWFRKIYKSDRNFFYNDILKRRTLQILDSLEQKQDYKSEIQKIKKKIIKMNKELEY